MVDWNPVNEDADQHSFEDSERFEEDSLCSWVSEHESVCTNWRGWKKAVTTRSSTIAATTATTAGHRGDEEGRVVSLVEICARQVAAHIPFEVVERVYPPVPEQIQLRITYWSFPDCEEDIRLYSCLANGSADEFIKGEQIYKSGGVREPLQIGFHLSARVSHQSYKGQYCVAVTFDRKRVSACTCSCDASAAWCAHIVAVCLQRIHQPVSVCLRAPVSESLSRLSRDQLQKFAQYLISELSQDMLPTAQRLLDDLLSGKPSRMNLACGAPDPTAGASMHELTSWCLDQRKLHENINKILIKFCLPSPTVFSDVNCLSSSAPPAATEWTSLLRPLRGREPEGLWNLLSIVREMFHRHDRNAVPLLEIITDQCLRCDQIVVWWVNSKLIVQSPAAAQLAKNQTVSSSMTCQHACASLCDEVVLLWRLAVLSPTLSHIDRRQIREQFLEWHMTALDTYKNKCRGAAGATAAGNSHNSRRQHDIDIFTGFKPAIEACDLDWSNYRLDSRVCVSTERIRHAERHGSQTSSAVHSSDAVLRMASLTADSAGNRSSVSSEGFCETDEQETVGVVQQQQATGAPSIAATSNTTPQHDSDAAVSDKDRVVNGLRPLADQWQQLMARAEGLHAHGFTGEACRVGVQLAQQLLARRADFSVDTAACIAAVSATTATTSSTSTTTTSNTASSSSSSSGGGKTKKRRGVHPLLHQMTNTVSCTLSRCTFLCTLLSERCDHHHLAFCVGLYGLEMNRPPASTKQLEVKLAHQEAELLQLLRRIPLGSQQLAVVRDRAEALRSGRLRNRGDALVPLSLANFVFDSLVVPARGSSCYRRVGDEELGFSAAVTALGLKANISEAEHPLLCEGTRRQRGDLAISLLLHYKDDQNKLAKIMDRLLDKEVHRMFKAPALSSYYSTPPLPSAGAGAGDGEARASLSVSRASTLHRHVPPPPVRPPHDALARMRLTDGVVTLQAASSGVEGASGACGASPTWEDNFKLWEAQMRGGGGGSVVAATSRRHATRHASKSQVADVSVDHSSSVALRGNWMRQAGPGSDSGSSGKSSDSGSSCGLVASTSASASASASSPGLSVQQQQQQQQQQQHNNGVSSVEAAGVANCRPFVTLTPDHILTRPIVSSKSNRFKGKKIYPSIPNQPSEAGAHFMFELAKNVLAKAGGNSSTSLFTQPSDNSARRGPHRALQMCAFQIGLYALGVHNCVTPNWLSRTYSTNVSWITGQAMELGVVSIMYLMDTWEGHLTPHEAACIADCASRSPDADVARVAAGLTLTVLPHAHALNQNEIQRALLQCKEQSVELLEKACVAVETAAKGGGVYPEILFTIAGKWYELYERASPRDGGVCVDAGGNMGELLEPPPPVMAHHHHINNSSSSNCNTLPVHHNAGTVNCSSAQHIPAQVHLSVTPSTTYPVTYGCAQVGMNQVSVQMYVPYTSTQYPTAVQLYPSLSVQNVVLSGVNRASVPPPVPPPSQLHQLPALAHGAGMSLYPVPHQPTHPVTATPLLMLHAPHHRAAVSVPTHPPPFMMPVTTPPPSHHHLPPPCGVSNMSAVSSGSTAAHCPPQLPPSAPPPPITPTSHTPPQPATEPSRAVRYLLLAYRVGMLALETLSRHSHDDRGVKFSRAPPYSEDVKWLLAVAMKLGTQCLHHFIACTLNSVFSPFVLYDVAVEVNAFLSKNNTASHYRSQMLAPLLQQCQQMYFSCMHVRLCHLTPPEYDDFVSIVCGARKAFSLTNNLPALQEFLHAHRRNKSLKKELWLRVNAVMQQPHPPVSV